MQLLKPITTLLPYCHVEGNTPKGFNGADYVNYYNKIVSKIKTEPEECVEKENILRTFKTMGKSLEEVFSKMQELEAQREGFTKKYKEMQEEESNDIRRLSSNRYYKSLNQLAIAKYYLGAEWNSVVMCINAFINFVNRTYSFGYNISDYWIFNGTMSRMMHKYDTVAEFKKSEINFAEEFKEIMSEFGKISDKELSEAQKKAKETIETETEFYEYALIDLYKEYLEAKETEPELSEILNRYNELINKINSFLNQCNTIYMEPDVWWV